MTIERRLHENGEDIGRESIRNLHQLSEDFPNLVNYLGEDNYDIYLDRFPQIEVNDNVITYCSHKESSDDSFILTVEDNLETEEVRKTVSFSTLLSPSTEDIENKVFLKKRMEFYIEHDQNRRVMLLRAYGSLRAITLPLEELSNNEVFIFFPPEPKEWAHVKDFFATGIDEGYCLEKLESIYKQRKLNIDMHLE
jgi:hypothetical protein